MLHKKGAHPPNLPSTRLSSPVMPKGPPASSFAGDPNVKRLIFRKRCRGLRKWGVRFLALDKRVKMIYYYHALTDQAPKCAIDLRKCSVAYVTPEEGDNMPGFKIIIPGFREYIFCANTVDEVEEWMHAMGSLVPLPPPPVQYQEMKQQQQQMQQQQAILSPPGSPIRTGTGGFEEPVDLANTIPVLVLVSDNPRIPRRELIVESGRIFKIGRQDDTPSSENPEETILTFLSKVVSRHHAEIFNMDGEVYLKDTRSQSGTFLNALRLSEAGRESKPYKLKSGDTIQLGVDFKGAAEDAKSISLRVQVKRRPKEVVAGQEWVGTGGPLSPRAPNSNDAGGAHTIPLQVSPHYA